MTKKMTLIEAEFGKWIFKVRENGITKHYTISEDDVVACVVDELKREEKVKRYGTKMVEEPYGFYINAVDVHNIAVKMGHIFAQLGPQTTEEMDLLDELKELIQELKVPC